MKDKTKKFIDKVKAKRDPRHIDVNGEWKYRYDKVDYIESKRKVTITCNKHGDFDQIPSTHLLGGGCSKCWSEYKAAGLHSLMSLDKVIKRAVEIHGDKYDYSKVVYKGITEKVIIICPIHGDFEQTFNKHLNSRRGCQKCGGTSKSNTKSFIENAIKVHGNKYDYSKVVYKDNRTRLTITCKIHGDFEQTAGKHIDSNRGCPKCGHILAGWTRTSFKDRCVKNNKGLGILYVIRCFNDSESFYKVGITSISVESRFKYKMPYEYEILHDIRDSPEKVFDSENEILRSFQQYKYEPSIYFEGLTECFNSIDPIETWLKSNIMQ